MNALPRCKEQTIERLQRRSRISDVEAEQVRRQPLSVGNLAAMKKLDLITEAVAETAIVKSSVYEAL